jgi:hypothetical protein
VKRQRRQSNVTSPRLNFPAVAAVDRFLSVKPPPCLFFLETGSMDDDEMLAEFVQACDANYSRRTGHAGAAVGFDPISIFTLILSIIAQICPKPPAELKRLAGANGLAATLTAQSATRRALREKHPGEFAPYAKYDGKAIAAAFLETVADASPERIAAVKAIVGE